MTRTYRRTNTRTGNDIPTQSIPALYTILLHDQDLEEDECQGLDEECRPSLKDGTIRLVGGRTETEVRYRT